MSKGNPIKSLQFPRPRPDASSSVVNREIEAKRLAVACLSKCPHPVDLWEFLGCSKRAEAGPSQPPRLARTVKACERCPVSLAHSVAAILVLPGPH